MKLVFCGTPAFAVPTLKLALRAGYDVALVVTQPDRPVGRGQHMTPPPVKTAAMEAGIRIAQPEKIKNNADLQAELDAIAPDVILVVAYGRIIPPWMLALPRLGNLNLHASLLPKYRGAAPVQWAIANGEGATGVTTMRLDEGLDTGDILLQRDLAIAPSMTATDVFPLLAEMGADLMMETLANWMRAHSCRETGGGASDAGADFDPRRWTHGFHAPGDDLVQPLARIPAVAGGVDDAGGKKLAVHRMLPTEVRGARMRQPDELRWSRARCSRRAAMARGWNWSRFSRKASGA